MRYCLLQHLLRVELQRFYPFYLFSKRDIIILEAHDICRTFTFKYLHQFLHE